MPFVSVWMRASTIDAPATASAPEIRLNKPAWSAQYIVTSVTARAGSGSVSIVSGARRLSASRTSRACRACVSGSNESQ